MTDKTTPVEVTDATDLLRQAREFLANSGAESGYCMCGDPVDSHSFGSGHSPVDSHVYYANGLIERIDAHLQGSEPNEA